MEIRDALGTRVEPGWRLVVGGTGNPNSLHPLKPDPDERPPDLSAITARFNASAHPLKGRRKNRCIRGHPQTGALDRQCPQCKRDRDRERYRRVHGKKP